MIIDFHTHVFPDKIAIKTIKKLQEISNIKAFADGTADSLVDSMTRAGVDCSINLPVLTKPEQFVSTNRFAVQLNEKYQNSKNKIISFGGIHPNSSNYREELKEIKRMGLKGIKLHPEYQGEYIDDIKYMRIIDYASELNLIITIHAGADIGFPDTVHATILRIKRVIREVAPTKFVLAHFGGWKLWDEVEQYIVGENVYLDTAFLFDFIEQEQFVRMVKHHGSDKILFATDCPWAGQKESIIALKNMQLPSEELEQIFYKNALKLLNYFE